jgi:hypothetical protein
MLYSVNFRFRERLVDLNLVRQEVTFATNLLTSIHLEVQLFAIASIQFTIKVPDMSIPKF